MIHIVKSTESKPRSSFGVAFDLLATGLQSMMTRMRYRPENVIPFHSHPNEQIGYVLSGRIRVLTRDSQNELSVGDTYAIPANVEHSIEIIEAAEEVQVFTPLREDFYMKANLSNPSVRAEKSIEGQPPQSPTPDAALKPAPMLTLRRPREALAGCIWLPRLIDKCRLHLAGTLPADYQIAFCSLHGIDGIFLDHFGIAPTDAQSVIHATRTDEDVARWFCAQPGVTPEKIERWNELAPNIGKLGHPGERGFAWARRHFLAACTDPRVISGFTAIAWDEGFIDEV